MSIGKVYLVGAGPGDETLITIKGKTAIKNADVILYDRLVNPILLQLAPDNCEFIYCGKLPDRHILRQESINALLVHHAQMGKIVVRLKGGDPSVFGRVGEEASELASHQIPFEIVPGITSGIAASIYAGIPVTHRNYGESFAVVTAHDKSITGKPTIDWTSLVNGISTIAFYMGVANLPYICENLIKHGKPADTPVILIQWGTMSRQKTLQGTLETISIKAKQQKFRNPAITLVGDIVQLREKMNWFESKPLFGKQLILAQTSCLDNKLTSELKNLGADVVAMPKWKKKNILSKEKREILSTVNQYESFIFTSLEGVHHFFQDIKSSKIDFRMIKANLFGIDDEIITAICEKGLLATKLKGQLFVDRKALEIGEIRLEELKSLNYDFYQTHLLEIDTRFLPIYKRMLEEANDQIILFPNPASIPIFLDYFKYLNCDVHSFLLAKKVICIGEETSMEAKKRNIKAIQVPLNNSTDLLQTLANER